MIFNCRRFPRIPRTTQVHNAPNIKGASVSGQHTGFQLAAQHRPNVPTRVQVYACNADATLLHAREMVDNDSHWSFVSINRPAELATGPQRACLVGATDSLANPDPRRISLLSFSLHRRRRRSGKERGLGGELLASNLIHPRAQLAGLCFASNPFSSESDLPRGEARADTNPSTQPSFLITVRQMHDIQIAPFFLQVFEHQTPVAAFGGWLAA